MIDFSESWFSMLLTPTRSSAAGSFVGTDVAAPRRPGVGVHPITVVGLAGAAAIALGWRGPLVGALLAVVILALPGLLLVRLVAAVDRVEAFVVVVATSLATWSIIAHVMLSLEWWQPRAAAAGLVAAMTVAHAVVDNRAR
jgi:hypothetical protein